MNKKIITVLIILLIIIISFAIYFMMQNNRNNEETNQGSIENLNNEEITENKTSQEENTIRETSKISNVAVIYFSATGNTENIAEYISKELEADLIEIEPENPYTTEDLNYNSDNCRANQEQNNDNARPAIANEINVDDYDTIYLGYPIWWGTVPKIILTFLDTCNLDGKTAIPFCTSGGSGISASQRDLENYNKNINWQTGRGFTGSSSQSDVLEWINE